MTIFLVGNPFDDRSYIVYVNSKIRDNTELGRLMHDFHCEDPKDMYNKGLADVVDDLKNGDKGDDSMCEIMDELIKEAVDIAVNETSIKTTIENYKDMDIPNDKIIEKLMAKYGLTKDKATKKVEEY